MSADPEALATKLRQMYPEIQSHGLGLSLEFDAGGDEWMVHLSKGRHKLSTHLGGKDAEACLQGVQCIYLGVQIAQFVKNFEAGE
jgi:hypothetical protein